MKQNIALSLIAVVLFIAGCGSDQGYLAQMKEAQTEIELVAQAAYAACQDNQTRAVATSVVANRSGKPFITKEVVNEETKQDLDEQWMNIEIKMGGISHPPEQYLKQHETIKKMYEACQKLYQMAVEPTGPVEQYQFTTDVLNQAITAKAAELNGQYAAN